MWTSSSRKVVNMQDQQLDLNYCKLAREFEKMKEAMGFLQTQVQSLTHRLNVISDKVSDQSVVIGKLID